jgi:hypothetical protein
MKGPSAGALAFVAVGVAALALVAVGAPNSRRAAPPAPPAAADAPSVSGNGVTLAAERIDLPADDAALPPGPHVDLVTANCTACHSANMILTQPPLKPEQWKATVTKMREVYKAPVPDAAVPGIIAYLSGLNAQPPAVTPPAS